MSATKILEDANLLNTEWGRKISLAEACGRFPWDVRREAERGFAGRVARDEWGFPICGVLRQLEIEMDLYVRFNNFEPAARCLVALMEYMESQR